MSYLCHYRANSLNLSPLCVCPLPAMDTIQTNPAVAISPRFISLLETLICQMSSQTLPELNPVCNRRASWERLSSRGVCVPTLNVNKWEHGAHCDENTAAQTQRPADNPAAHFLLCPSPLQSLNWMDFLIILLFNTIPRCFHSHYCCLKSKLLCSVMCSAGPRSAKQSGGSTLNLHLKRSNTV